jgi:hypothetical protein
LNAGSAKQCVCGHAFADATIVKARTTKRCPACREEQPVLLLACGCGHEFDDIREGLEELEAQVRMGWSYVALGVTVFLLAIGLLFVTQGLWITLGWFGGVALAARGISMRAGARAELREIRGATLALPSARVVARDRDA